MADSKECYNGDKSGIATPSSVLRVDQVTFRAPAPFSLGTDASVWLARMEEYLQQNGISRDRWTSVARSFLSDDVYAQVMQWPLTVNAPFADFAKMFAERYSPIESTLDARAKFVSRRQLPGESLNTYADAIMLLGRKANYDDTLVRDQFFLGLRNAELKRQLYSSRNEPWQQFLSIARETDFSNQLFPTDAAHAAVVQAPAENERVQPMPSLDAETADSQRAISVVRADTPTPRLNGGNSRPDYAATPAAYTCLPSTYCCSGTRITLLQLRRPRPPITPVSERTATEPTSSPGKRPALGIGSVPRGTQSIQLPTPLTGRSQQEAVHVVAFTKPSSIFVQANVAGTDSQLLLDTGAAVTLIREDLFNSLSPKPELRPVYVRLLSASGDPLDVLGTCRLPIRFVAQSFAHTLFVARNLAFPGLLGADFLLSNGCVINLDDNVLRIGSTEVHLERPSQICTANTPTKPCRAVLRDTVLVPGRSEILVYACCPAIPERTECVFSPSPLLPDRHAVVAANSVGTVTTDSRIVVRLLNPDPTPVTLYAGSTVGELTPLPEAHSVRYVNQVVPSSGATDHDYRRITDEMLPSLEELDAHSRNALRSVLWKYRRCIATSDEDLGHTELASHRIDTRNAAPVKVPPRRLPPAQRPDVQRMVTDMLSRNVIEPANSPWSAPIVIVRKKDGSPRFCVDFRRLNDVTIKDAHPLPRIDDTLEALSGARWFSTLDFSSGYWQIPVDEADRPKTAFSTPFGLYQFRVMPFGLCNAPATFQRLMDVALRGLTWSSCLAYLDDIIVFGRTAQEHTDRLERVLQRIAETGLKLKPQKCHLMRKTVRFLGHVLSENGMSTDEEKIRAVKEWPTPCCPSEVRQFLGLASYYRRFIKNFSMVSAPLNALLRKGSHWKWTAECQTAFDQLKHMLCTAPVLTFPDFNVPFIVDVDASAEGIGAVLSQLSHGNERVVAYASRTLTKAERRYCVTRKELLALVWSIKEFRPYLYGQQFDARTDHSCLRWLRNFKEPEGQVARWLEQLAEYDFNVLHRPGRAHCNADALSRQRCPQCGISIVATATPPVATMEEVCKIFGVEKSRSSPYHPQGNGLVERANRTLLNTLAKLCHESQDRSWDQLLPLATMAYNSAVHETTGQSPFCMLFGKQMSLPLDVTLDVPPGTASNADDYVVQLRENLQKLHSTAFDRSRHEQQRHKEIADRKATANRFETGQLVWLKVPQKGKMDMRWSGPFRVLKQLGVETYRVQDVGRPRRRLVVHSDRLKAYHTGIDQEATAGGSEPPGGSGDVLRTTWTFKGPVVRPDMTGSHAQGDVRPQAAERDRPRRVRRPPRRFDDFVRKECYNGDKSGIATPSSVLRVDQVTFRAPAPFSLGTDASVWLARMEEYLQQNGISRDRWTSVARSFLSDDVYAQVMQWPLTVNAPFADFAKMFAERYSPIESTLDARAKFVSRRQLPGESLNTYADAIMLLGRKANYDDTLVRDQFFLGLRNAELKRQLYSSRNEPWQQFLSIARETDFSNQLFPTDAAHAAVVQAPAENERVQPMPSLDAETADSQRAISVVRADTPTPRLNGGNSRPDYAATPAAYTCLPSTYCCSGTRITLLQLRRPRPPITPVSERTATEPTSSPGKRPALGIGSVPRGTQSIQLPTPLTGRSQQEAVHVVAFTKPSSIFVQANVAGTDSQLLLDTGAAVTLIREDLFNSLSPKPELRPVYVRLLSASGDPLDVLGTCRLPIRFVAQSFAHTLFVARNLAFPGLLGADFLLSNGCVINLDDNVLRIGSTEVHLERPSQICTANTPTKPCRAVLRDTVLVPGRSEILVYACCPAIPERTECVFSPSPLLPDRHAVVAANSVGTVTTDSRIVVRLLNPDPTPVTLYAGSTVGELTPLPEAHSVRYVNQVVPSSGATDHDYRRITDEMLPSLEELDAHSRNALRSVLWKYRRCIATSDEDLGHTELASHRIDTRNAAPVKVPPRRLPPAQRPDVQRMVTDMLSRNVIEPANSPWSAPIVIVRKKDGSPRFCVDFRRLNDVTIKDAHPLPRIDDTLEALSGARWFSTLDFSSGYWQIPVDEADRPKTAFSTPFGLYQFRVMPFGLCNAPATFQRLMDVALRGLTWSSCLAYLDDIIVFGRTAQEHTDRLERVLQRIAETGLKLKPQKCHLMRKTVRFLGHVLSENGMSTDEEKIRAVKEWPTPCCPSEVRQFLGLASYYRRFIKNFSMVSAPLNALLRKGSHWKWTAECQTAFDQLKHMLCTAPVLTFPDFNVPFIVDVDASAEGIGAVLSQLSHGNERVVAYASRTLTKAERRYCVTRKELLALVWSIKEFRPYLYGQQFDARTDHSCLRWLRNFKEPEGQVARWLEQLAEYDFNVLHRPGRAHCNADALSRQRCPQCGISLVATATPPVATMEEVTPSRCLSIVDIQTWQQAQSTDATLSVLRSWLAANRWPRHCPTSSDPDLWSLWRDGRGVFRVDENGLLRRRQASSDYVDDQLIVPKELRNDVLTAMHNTTFGGHFASRRTLDRLQRRYFWPRMRKAVDAWCQACR
ncbi:Retrovirus-related Pol polyprotein from transposon 17.6, partial [Trichinella papuae]